MALFGELEHHALTDLVKVLAPQTGTLFFHQAYQGRTLELTLMQGHLRAMYLDGFPVQTGAQVRDILHHLHTQGRGAFEFQRRGFPTSVSGFYDLPLSDLVGDFGDVGVPADQLPHPETRFLAVPGLASVPDSLSSAWALLQPQLLNGASATDIAARLGLSVREVQGLLHRLRAVDLIAPQRAAALPSRPAPRETALLSPASSGAPALEPLPAATVPAAGPTAAPIVQRLLGALRRLTGARA